ncbi:hypothetical protein EDB80DRAFT_230019 [Ilyonectria destructans]|nr:hypothetical protein EDB80DRAFT_230019 [Ilyonectria destructans]
MPPRGRRLTLCCRCCRWHRPISPTSTQLACRDDDHCGELLNWADPPRVRVLCVCYCASCIDRLGSLGRDISCSHSRFPNLLVPPSHPSSALAWSASRFCHYFDRYCTGLGAEIQCVKAPASPRLQWRVPLECLPHKYRPGGPVVAPPMM